MLHRLLCNLFISSIPLYEILPYSLYYFYTRNVKSIHGICAPTCFHNFCILGLRERVKRVLERPFLHLINGRSLIIAVSCGFKRNSALLPHPKSWPVTFRTQRYLPLGRVRSGRPTYGSTTLSRARLSPHSSRHVGGRKTHWLLYKYFTRFYSGGKKEE